MWPKIFENYSLNFNQSKRSKKDIKFIIIHYTGMKKELAAINRLCNVKSKVSAHFFVKKKWISVESCSPTLCSLACR